MTQKTKDFILIMAIALPIPIILIIMLGTIGV